MFDWIYGHKPQEKLKKWSPLSVIIKSHDLCLYGNLDLNNVAIILAFSIIGAH